MTTVDVLSFLRANRLAVQASRSASETIQAALIGFAVTDELEVVFDTLNTARKVANLRSSPHVALVIGGWSAGDERTVQYEGIADEPTGDELERLKRVYFAAWPDGPSRARWPGLVYVRVRPTWIRYSDFNQNPPVVVEFAGRQLRAAPANER
jgi:Pyridoxamine 5'-phosphate oxidase